MDGSEGKQTPQGCNRTHTLGALEFPLLQLHCCFETCREAGISHLKAMGALSPELRKMLEGIWSGGRAGGAGRIANAGGAHIHTVSQQMVKYDCCLSFASEPWIESPVARANLELCGEENWGSLIPN